MIRGLVAVEPAGFQECSDDVVGQVLAAGNRAAQVFETTDHGFGGAVGGVGVAEINQDCPRPAV